MNRGRSIAAGPTPASDIEEEEDNKETKYQKTQSQRMRHVVLFLLILSAAGFALGLQPKGGEVELDLQHDFISPQQQQLVGMQDTGPTEKHLQRTVDELDKKVRAQKALPEVIMERDSEGMKLTKELQHATHKLLVKRYGRHAFRVRVDLEFPEVIVQQDGLPAQDYILIELAPIDLIPCSVYNFLEIARMWKSGAFHRNAGHVLQVEVKSGVRQSMPFQEYSPEHPHAKGTTGYAGRPSGPAWYISIKDNSKNHGPGSQQKHNPYEADSNFGNVVRGMSDVVPRIHSTPQDSWLDKEHQIAIPKMTILIPDPNKKGDWIPWEPHQDAEVGGMATMR